MIDTTTALEAAETWATLARLVPTIELYLTPRPGKSEVRMPPSSKPPIDLVASDLLMELDIAASFYVSALVMETHDVKRFPDGLAAQLALVGERYGHFTAGEEKLAIDFCDEAHELMRKVSALVLQPAPPKWLGPCRECNNGDLWLKQARANATCDECNASIDMGTWREGLWRALESTLMERDQIAPAIRLLGGKCTPSTVRSWIHRGRLVPIIADSELFRFMDAVDLAHISPGVAVDNALQRA